MSLVEITFNNDNNNVYYGGNILKGRLNLIITEQTKKIHEVHLIVRGISSVRWLESQPGGKANRNVIFHGKKFLINSKTILYENYEKALDLGNHSFDFQCQLPLKIPPSFECSEGCIRYYVQAILNDSWRNQYRKYFTVRGKKQILDHSGLSHPMIVNETKKFGVLFWQSKPLTIKVTFMSSIFLSGSDLIFNIFYDNKSKVDINCTGITFRRIAILTSSSPRFHTKTHYTKIEEFYTDGVKKESQNNFEKILKIPHHAVTSNKNDNNIKISYELKITVMTGVLHKNFEISVPLIIITGNSIIEDSPPVYDEILENLHEDSPPTYEETMMMNTKHIYMS